MASITKQQEVKIVVGENFVPKMAPQFNMMNFYKSLVFRKKSEPMEKEAMKIIGDNSMLKIAPQFNWWD